MLRTISCNPLGELTHHIHLQASIKRATLSRMPTILCSANKNSKLHFVLSSGLRQSKIDTNGMCVDVGRTHQDAIIYYRHSMCASTYATWIHTDECEHNKLFAYFDKSHEFCSAYAFQYHKQFAQAANRKYTYCSSAANCVCMRWHSVQLPLKISTEMSMYEQSLHFDSGRWSGGSLCR